MVASPGDAVTAALPRPVTTPRVPCRGAGAATAAPPTAPTTPATRLTAPVTVVVAADDPSTTGFTRRHGEWRLLTDEVDLRQLADGGHYFLRTRPAQAAEAVLQAAALSPSFA